MEDKSFILIIAVPGILVFVALFNFIGNNEAFGLNPLVKDCIGSKIGAESVRKYFPAGNVEFKTPIHIKYSVSKKTDAKSFCLGQIMN